MEMIEISSIPPFDKEFKRLNKKYKSLLKDIYQLREDLKKNPSLGTDLGKGVRKVRMAITAKGKGKSHGARIITYTDALFGVEDGKLILFFIYDKAERDTISDKEIEALLQYIQ